MDNKKILVAITHGDTNGIGYELIFKTFSTPEMLELCTPIIYGSPKVAAYHRKALDTQANFTIINHAEEAHDGKVNLLTCFNEEVKVDLGKPTQESHQAGVKALDKALEDFKNGCFQVLVTMPINKNMEYQFPGQVEYIEKKLEDTNDKSTVIICNNLMRIALATKDIAIKDVSKHITIDHVAEKLKTLHTTLRRDFRIFNPRIAVLALNPNADGEEETTIIKPVIEKQEELHIEAFGPFTTDDFFRNEKYKAFDGILAMYHDQGTMPFNTIQGDCCFTMLAGIPYVCTSPTLSPSFEIAGQNKGDESSLRQAIYSAIDVYRNRINYDEPYENPLEKLYHEKRDEGEKIRFSIPKKHEKA